MLLDVPRYDFNWQIDYMLAEPKLMPKGTVLRCEAHFDNSADNPTNPDPDQVGHLRRADVGRDDDRLVHHRHAARQARPDGNENRRDPIGRHLTGECRAGVQARSTRCHRVCRIANCANGLARCRVDCFNGDGRGVLPGITGDNSPLAIDAARCHRTRRHGVRRQALIRPDLPQLPRWAICPFHPSKVC